MAQFNKDQQHISADDTAASKGYKPNTAFADLFSAAGEIATNAVKIVDQENLIQISSEVHKEVDQLNNEWGANASAFETNVANPNNTQPLPTDLNNYGSELNKLKKARANGSLKDSFYQARIDSLSRQVRSRYPGYRDEIDKIINQTLGLSTANDYRKALVAEWDAEQASAGDDDKRFASEVTQAREAGALPPGYDAKVGTAEAYDKQYTRTFMAAKYAKLAEVKNVKAEVDLSKSLREEDLVQTTKAANLETGFVVSNVLEGTLSVAKLTPAKLQTMVAQGTKLSDSDLEIVLNEFNVLQGKTKGQLWSQLNTPTYSSLDFKAKKDIVDSHMAELDNLGEMIKGQSWGLVNATKTLNDSRVERALKGFYDANPLAVRMKALGQFTDGNIIYNSILESAQPQGQLKEAMTNFLTLDTFAKGSLDQVLQDGTVQNGGQKLPASVIKQTTDNAVKILLSKDASPEILEQAAKVLFSKENQAFLNKFSPDSQKTLFDHFTSARVTKRMLELKETSPESFTNYRNWMLNAFEPMFNQDIAGIVDVNKFGDSLRIEWNAAKGAFEPGINPQAAERGAMRGSQPGGTLAAVWEKFANDEAGKSMDTLNSYIQRLKPVIEAEGGTVEDAMTAIFEKYHINDAPNQGSIFYRFYEAIQNKSAIGRTMRPDPELEKELMQNPELDQFDLPSEGDEDIDPPDVEGRSIIDQSRKAEAKEADEDYTPDMSDEPKSVTGKKLTPKSEVYQLLESRLVTKGRTEDLDGLDEGFATNVAALIQSAPPEIAKHLGVLSGSRSQKRQKKLFEDAVVKYGSVSAARKWVAPPIGMYGSKGSRHGRGVALDLSWKGGFFRNAPPEVIEWVHKNAGKYGMHFPLGHEPWHIEAKGSRSKLKVKE